MLENTHKIYQLVLDTEKKFDDEKAELIKKRETLQKKVDSKIPFANATKKIEARYEIEKIDKLLADLDAEKREAVFNLDLLPQLTVALKTDEKSWESVKNKEIDSLLENVETNLIKLLFEAQDENYAYMSAQDDLTRQLGQKMENYGYSFDNVDINLMKGTHIGYQAYTVGQKLRFIQSQLHGAFDPARQAAFQMKKYGIKTQSTAEERQKEIEEKGAYYINEGNLVIVDNAKYDAWWDKEYGEKSKKK